MATTPVPEGASVLQAPVVLDTNVFVAAGFNPGSHAARILDAVERGQLRMVWNEATRREITMILHRIPPLAKQPVDNFFRQEAYFAGATFLENFAIIPDPDDRKFAALAHAAGAILISRDEHFLAQRAKLAITVLTAREYWRRYGREGEQE